MAPRNAAISPPRLGDHLRRPPPPGPRLPGSSRVSGLGRGRGATDVPDEYTDLTRYVPGTRLNRPISPEPGGARWRSFGRAPSAGPRTRATRGRRWTRPRLQREAAS